MDAYLATGDQTLADAFCLTDNINAFVLGAMYMAPTRQMVPGGVNFGIHARGYFHSTVSSGPSGSEPITLGIFAEGQSWAQVQDNMSAVLRKDRAIHSGGWQPDDRHADRVLVSGQRRRRLDVLRRTWRLNRAGFHRPAVRVPFHAGDRGALLRAVRPPSGHHH